MNYWKNRRVRKTAREILKHAHHCRHLREDLLSAADRLRLSAAEKTLEDFLRGDDMQAIERAGDDLYAETTRLVPPRPFPRFRENFEILVVAVVVAMGFRTYLVQPFKIPTGSMQPTLYGIQTDDSSERAFHDTFPISILKWIAFGERFQEVRIKESGLVYREDPPPESQSVRYSVAGRTYAIPRNARPNPKLHPGAFAYKGDLLWSGRVTTGDHVFVDKVRWNFSRPARGQVMVFVTDGISGAIENTHYIKRLVGLPGESIAIVAPNILVDGKPVFEPPSIVRIERCEHPYEAPYHVPNAFEPSQYMTPARNQVQLGAKQYLVLGDNTMNSRDSRYWGPVPQQNVVGPAFLVYWPFSHRWGRIR